jgi:hypothetical protein
MQLNKSAPTFHNRFDQMLPFFTLILSFLPPLELKNFLVYITAVRARYRPI